MSEGTWVGIIGIGFMTLASFACAVFVVGAMVADIRLANAKRRTLTTDPNGDAE